MAPELPAELVVAFEGCDGGLHLSPARPGPPKSMWFQGGLFHVEGFNFEGRVVSPPSHAGRPILVFISPLGPWHFRKGRLEFIGHVYDRTDHDPALGAHIYVPKDDWLPMISCLGSVWRRLTLRLGKTSEHVESFSFASASQAYGPGNPALSPER